MTDTVQISIITCSFTFLGLLVSRWLSHREHMATAAKVKETEAKVAEVHVLVNDKMTELLRAVRAEERAAGVAEGRELGNAERKDRVIESERVEDRESKMKEPK